MVSVEGLLAAAASDGPTLRAAPHAEADIDIEAVLDGLGGALQKLKTCLILDVERYRYQKFISDIAGQDIEKHSDDPQEAVKRVRDWLRTESARADIPGGIAIYKRYESFRQDLPAICEKFKLDINELTFVDFSMTVAAWLEKQP